MTTTQDLRSSTSSPLVEDLDASGILAAARERKAAEDRAAADLLDLAAAVGRPAPAGVDPLRRLVHRPRV